MDRLFKLPRLFRFERFSEGMSFPPMREGREAELILWVVPLAALLAIRGVGALQSDSAALVESRYLALLVAGVLAAIAALVRNGKATANVLVWTALLASSSAWLAYQGPSRGAVVSTLLAGGLMAAILHAAQQAPPVWTPAATVPMALGLQLLLRGDLLLPPLLDARTLVSLLVLPVIAGVALSVLASIYGDQRAAVVAAVSVILAPGFNVTTTASLAAVAAGALLAHRDQDDAASSAGVQGAAIFVLILLLLWNRPLGALLALTGLSLWSRGLPALLLPVAGFAATWLTSADNGWGVAFDRWVAALTLVPAWSLIFFSKPRSETGSLEVWIRGFHGALFMVFAAKVGAGPDVLTGGLALIALAAPSSGPGGVVQRSFSALLVAGTALLAAYPWTRLEPREDLLELFARGVGLDLDARFDAVVLCVALAAAVAASALVLDRLAKRLGARRAGSYALVIVVLAGASSLAQGLRPTEVVIDSFRAVRLGSDRPNWGKSFVGRAVRMLVFDTQLIHGSELDPGTPIAIVRLRDYEQEPLAVWRIRAGEHTAEWAAARPDIANRPGFRSPPHWIARLALKGDFFSRLFRSRFVPDEPLEAESVTVQIAPELPPEVLLVISRLEVRE